MSKVFVDFLSARSAQGLAHVTGSLLDHLHGTAQLLHEWGNPPHICDAGLAHAVYGTSGFPTALLDVETERHELARMIGPEAEDLVYFYASCDRAYVYPQIGVRARLDFRDRFSGRVYTPDPTLLASFMEVTFANELAIAVSDAAEVAAVRNAYGALFTRCRSLVSPAAYACFERLCGEGDRSAV